MLMVVRIPVERLLCDVVLRSYIFLKPIQQVRRKLGQWPWFAGSGSDFESSAVVESIIFAARVYPAKNFFYAIMPPVFPGMNKRRCIGQTASAAISPQLNWFGFRPK
jgi:hypothetical protein